MPSSLPRRDHDRRVRQTSRERPPRRVLSREAVLDAALRILDRDGLDAVTMRRVADDLDTGPASLYAHVAHKDDLIDALLDRVIGELDISDPPDPWRWQEQLKQWVRDTRALFSRHNDLARASLGRIPTGANALPVIEWTLAVLKAGNVPDQVAAWSADILALYAVALVAGGGEERFEFGLDLLVRGIASTVR